MKLQTKAFLCQLLLLLAFSRDFYASAFTSKVAVGPSSSAQSSPTTSSYQKLAPQSIASDYHVLRAVALQASTSSNDNGDDVCTIQILMSDTGGGHRASANALRDAFDILYPGRIKCDIVDLFVEYGKVWPYKDYPALYKFGAKYSFLWDWFYRFGETEFGLWLNVLLQELACYDSFRECLNRPSCGTSKRADMVVSVHPLCQDVPLKAMADLDTDGKTKDLSARTTPFVTVVTDLGGVSASSFQSTCVLRIDTGQQCVYWVLVFSVVMVCLTFFQNYYSSFLF